MSLSPVCTPITKTGASGNTVGAWGRAPTGGSSMHQYEKEAKDRKREGLYPDSIALEYGKCRDVWLDSEKCPQDVLDFAYFYVHHSE